MITLKEYIKQLKKLEKEHGHKFVVYSIDDEGNDFKYVFYRPSSGYLLDKGNVVFIN
jgi:hypothetical protein